MAAHAGVSHQTVSRVINEQANVNAATRERVQAAIRELGYVPNPSARSLSSNRVHTLGLVTTDISDYFFSQAVAGAEAEARKRGLFLIIGSVEEEAEGDERAYLRLMLERRVEGLIVAGPTLHLERESIPPSVTERVPIVALAGELGRNVSVVDVDNRRGGFDATSYLLDRGHREIATITGPLEWTSARERLDGYREALRRAGIAGDDALVRHCSDWGLESGQAATASLLDDGRPFTAIFTQSDLFALGALKELRARGTDVPGAVSIIGYDDIPVAAFVEPALTTMHQPMRDVGALAVRVVVDAISSDGGPEGERESRRLLRAPLVVRGSVGPPPA